MNVIFQNPILDIFSGYSQLSFTDREAEGEGASSFIMYVIHKYANVRIRR